MAKKTSKTKTEQAKVTEPTKAGATKAPSKKTTAKVEAKQKLSALDAAAKMLGETGQPMTCREIVEAMASKGLWTSPTGATPWNTLNAAISREIKVKGKDSRFTKTEPGKFAKSGK